MSSSQPSSFMISAPRILLPPSLFLIVHNATSESRYHRWESVEWVLFVGTGDVIAGCTSRPASCIVFLRQQCPKCLFHFITFTWFLCPELLLFNAHQALPSPADCHESRVTETYALSNLDSAENARQPSLLPIARMSSVL